MIYSRNKKNTGGSDDQSMSLVSQIDRGCVFSGMLIIKIVMVIHWRPIRNMFHTAFHSVIILNRNLL